MSQIITGVKHPVMLTALCRAQMVLDAVVQQDGMQC